MHAFAWQFPAFAHWYKGGAEPERNHRAQKKAPSIEPNDDIDLLVGRGRYSIAHEMMGKVGDESLEGQWVAENREDVTKGHTLIRP